MGKNKSKNEFMLTSVCIISRILFRIANMWLNSLKEAKIEEKQREHIENDFLVCCGSMRILYSESVVNMN